MKNYFKPAIFLLSLWPIYIITYQIFYNQLGPEPVDRIINHFGEWTLIFILLTLSMTPLKKITKSLEWIKFRRMLGLFAFFYASIHMLSYVGLDYRFDFDPLINDVLKKKFVFIGFSGVTAMALRCHFDVTSILEPKPFEFIAFSVVTSMSLRCHFGVTSILEPKPFEFIVFSAVTSM